MRDYKKLKVWEKANQYVLKIYKITQKFPKTELYGLTSQLRWAAVSIPTNIAEGCGRGSVPELLRFFQISAGSASECQYLIELSFNLQYLDREAFDTLNHQIIEIKKMLRSYINKSKKSNI